MLIKVNNLSGKGDSSCPGRTESRAFPLIKISTRLARPAFSSLHCPLAIAAISSHRQLWPLRNRILSPIQRTNEIPKRLASPGEWVVATAISNGMSLRSTPKTDPELTCALNLTATPFLPRVETRLSKLIMSAEGSSSVDNLWASWQILSRLCSICCRIWKAHILSLSCNREIESELYYLLRRIVAFAVQ